MNAGIRVSGVSELVLELVDLAAAEHFYGEVLGLPLVERWDDREMACNLASYCSRSRRNRAK